MTRNTATKNTYIMFQTRTLRLINDHVRALATAAVQNAPNGIEVILREPKKVRGPSQNSLMWASALKDIAEQAWFDGRQFSEEVLHEHMKREFLPEADDPELERLVKDVDKWHKWQYLPSGDRILTGSTTQLTPYGFGQYLEQVYAFGASLGVLFGVRE